MHDHLILNSKQIHQKIKRLAVEVLEHHVQSNGLIIIGIKGNGSVLAKHIQHHINQFGTLKTDLLELQLSKSQPHDSIQLPAPSSGFNYSEIPVLLIDDVMNSGKTMLYAIRHVLGYNPLCIETLFLIQRSYSQFPVLSNYIGLRLNTTLQEHVSVELHELTPEIDRVILN